MEDLTPTPENQTPPPTNETPPGIPDAGGKNSH